MPKRARTTDNADLVPPRLLIVSHGGGRGGMRVVVDALDRGLGERGWAVDSVVVEYGSPAEVEDWSARQGSAVRVGPRVPLGAGPWNWLRRAWLLHGLVRQFRPDVVSIHYSTPHVPPWDIVALRMGGARCLATAHVAVPLQVRIRFSTRTGAALAHGLTAPSEGVARVFADAGVPLESVRVIRNGVPVPTQGYKSSAAVAAEGAVVVGCVTRLAPEKHVGDLIRAMRLLDGEAVELVVVGDGPLRRTLEEQAEAVAPGRVTFAGWQYDMDAVYDRVDILALPSTAEGLPLVVLEAAARGIPAVATDIPGTNEAVVDGITGLLVPANDVDALAGAIRRLVRDPSLRRRLGEAARERVLRDFGEQRMVGEYDALFREGLGRRRNSWAK